MSTDQPNSSPSADPVCCIAAVSVGALVHTAVPATSGVLNCAVYFIVLWTLLSNVCIVWAESVDVRSESIETNVSASAPGIVIAFNLTCVFILVGDKVSFTLLESTVASNIPISESIVILA